MQRDDDDLISALGGILEGETDLVANAANTAALLFERLRSVNWVGFYFLRRIDGRDLLLLGPFQGRVACVRIEMGQGVCGAAATRRRTVRVADVHEFPGHIACDPASRSELVVPLLRGSELVGVLDLDSPEPDRFSAEDETLCEQVASLLMRSTSR